MIDKHFLAAVLSILVIVLAVALHARSAPSPSGSLTGYASIDAAAPFSVSARINGVPASSTLTIEESGVRVNGNDGAFQVLSIVLDGSANAQRASFSLTHEGKAIALTSSRQSSGEWMALITADRLATIRAQSGSGWYVFDGEAENGGVTARSTVAVFIS